VRRNIRSVLADQTAWQLYEAENGKTAVDLTKKDHPDVVVLDIVMPAMSGLEAAYEITRFAPKTKIVFISSHYTAEQAAVLTRLFGADFVPKSEVGKQLVPAIKKLRLLTLAYGRCCIEQTKTSGVYRIWQRTVRPLGSGLPPSLCLLQPQSWW
jgi:two-component system chemotaxis response regulator CheY